MTPFTEMVLERRPGLKRRIEGCTPVSSNRLVSFPCIVRLPGAPPGGHKSSQREKSESAPGPFNLAGPAGKSLTPGAFNLQGQCDFQ